MQNSFSSGFGSGKSCTVVMIMRWNLTGTSLLQKKSVVQWVEEIKIKTEIMDLQNKKYAFRFKMLFWFSIESLCWIYKRWFARINHQLDALSLTTNVKPMHKLKANFTMMACTAFKNTSIDIFIFSPPPPKVLSCFHHHTSLLLSLLFNA